MHLMRQCLTRSLYNIWCRSPGRVQASLEVEEDSAVVSAVVSAEDSSEDSSEDSAEDSAEDSVEAGRAATRRGRGVLKCPAKN